MKYLLILLLFSIFTIACDDNPSGGKDETCKNKCNVENEKTCTDNSVMICKKDENGCLILEKVEDCPDICESGICKENNNTCDPACEDWQTCDENQTCKTREGKCADNNECTDNKVCVNHECTEQTTKTVTKKVVIGAGNKSASAGFKLKLNVGKITTIKKARSSNFNLKLGTSTIQKK